MRKAFVMHLNADALGEYQRRHSPIWRELENVLKEHGASNYSIYVDSLGHQLFGYVEIEDESRWNTIAQTEVCQRWWRYMADLMATNPDKSPVSDSLTEVFHLD